MGEQQTNFSRLSSTQSWARLGCWVTAMRQRPRVPLNRKMSSKPRLRSLTRTQNRPKRCRRKQQHRSRPSRPQNPLRNQLLRPHENRRLKNPHQLLNRPPQLRLKIEHLRETSSSRSPLLHQLRVRTLKSRLHRRQHLLQRLQPPTLQNLPPQTQASSRFRILQIPRQELFLPPLRDQQTPGVPPHLQNHRHFQEKNRTMHPGLQSQFPLS